MYLTDVLQSQIDKAHRGARASFLQKPGVVFAEEDGSDADFEVEDVEPFSMAMDIEYRKSINETVLRRIKLIKVIEKNDDVNISCWCFLRESYRTFKLSKIVSVIDIGSGEVFDDARTYFVECGILNPMSDEAKAVRQCFNELIVLSFLGACDGAFLPCEQEAILHHVLERYDAPLNEDDIRRRLGQIMPDERAFRRAVRSLEADDTARRALVRSIRRVIDADGHAHENEIIIGAELLKAIGVSL